MNSRVYTLRGDIQDFHNKVPLFRKMTKSKVEKEISKILMKNPHPNIVRIYDVTDDYVDMEFLDTRTEIDTMTMIEAKTHLQKLGILYIDWKSDNIGTDSKGVFKLFDFDVSGTFNTVTGEWILEPSHFYAYNKAIKQGAKSPIDIDNYAFKSE